MEIIEQINKYLESLWSTIRENWIKITSFSVITWLALPIIKWAIYGLRFMIHKTPETLDKFAEVTFVDNFLPWWLSILTEPSKTFLSFILIFFFVANVLLLIKEYFQG